jgi:hypothetical protein
MNPSDEAKPQPATDSGALHCPVCASPLRKGRALLTGAAQIGPAYYCPTCLVIYTPDLEVLARMVGGVN